MTVEHASDLIGYLTTTLTFIGLSAGMFRWRLLSNSLRWVTIWLGLSTAADTVALLYETRWHTAQPIVAVWELTTLLCVAEALSSFQRDRTIRRRFRAGWLAYALFWCAMHATVEHFAWYGTYTEPVAAALSMTMAVTLIYRRVALSRIDLWRDPAFVVACAFAGSAFLSGFLPLVAQIWFGGSNGPSQWLYLGNNAISALVAAALIRSLWLRDPRSQRAFG